MRIVIDISEDAYNKLMQKSMLMSASAIDEAVDAVKKGQVIQKGHWLKAQPCGIVSYSDAYAQCSCCEARVFSGRLMPYCPKCGARMEEGDS